MNSTPNTESFLQKYRKIKIVGKGSSGTAILYERINDKKLVVVKEINLLDLSENEKEMALNEVHVLSVLSHPNIISYYGSIEQNGSLFIEMEYADNGTLAQLLNNLNKTEESVQYLPSSIIIHIFSQIVSAICHIHSNKILHRDLKTANIFLNTNGSVKVGDFGLSKLLTTRIWTDTVLGTPFYLSPEMCIGEEYNEKSDIWALGCILYEMITLKRPFQASNLTALVKKITEDDIIPLPEDSNYFQKLITNLLQKQAYLRPNAEMIKNDYLPAIVKELSQKEGSAENFDGERNVLYLLQSFKNNINLQPINLPPKKFIQISVSDTHYIALSSDNNVYKWYNLKNPNEIKNLPTVIKPMNTALFLGKSIIKVAAGNNFSLFLTNDRNLLIEGDIVNNSSQNQNLQVIESLKNVQIKNIKSGNSHAIALTEDGNIYCWGKNVHGCLGLGEPLENKTDPTKIILPLTYNKITKIFSGSNSTGILDSNGILYLCGSNICQKLTTRKVEFISKLSQVQYVKSKIKMVSLGEYHTAILTVNGQIYTLGNNDMGQLGYGHNKMYDNNPKIIQFLQHQVVIDVTCGSCYTAAITNTNVLYMWGKQFSFSLNSHPPINPLLNTVMNSQKPVNSDETVNFFDEMATTHLTNHVYVPKPILALFSSPDQISRNKIVKCEYLKAISAYSMLLTVTSTVPPKKQQLKQNYTYLFK